MNAKKKLKEAKMEWKQGKMERKEREEEVVQPGRVCYKLVAVSFIALTDSCLHDLSLSVSNCYVRIPKESRHCRKRKVRGSEVCPADSY